MDIFTFFTPAEMSGLDSNADIVIVFDVLRATTTITAAFKNGAAKVIPADDIDEAFELNKKLGIETTLLCGTHQGKEIDGFDLGSSPLQYVPEKIEGKVLIYYSQNTTAAINKSLKADRILLGCFNNVQAAISNAEYPSKIHLLCAGKMGRFSFEDAVCAGMFIQRLIDSYSGEVGLNDASVTSQYIYYRHRKDIEGMLRKSSQGHLLIKKHYESDLEFAALVDKANIVPELSLDKTHIIPTSSLKTTY